MAEGRSGSVWESRVLRLGALAGAIAAVIGLVVTLTGLLPDDPDESAAIEGVDVGAVAGIRSAFARTGAGRECDDLPDDALRVARPPLPLAVLQIAQVLTTETVPEDGGEETETTVEGGSGAVVAGAGIPHTITLDDLALIDEIRPPPFEGPVEFAPQALRVSPADFSSPEEQAVLRQVALTRTSASGAQAEPVGRLIDVGVRLEGLDDECIQLAWSLYDEPTGDVVPERWLRFRTGLRFVVDGDEQFASEQFWVPLPRRGGRFFVRMGLFKEDGTRLAIGRSPPFRQVQADVQGFVPTS